LAKDRELYELHAFNRALYAIIHDIAADEPPSPTRPKIEFC